MSKKDHNWKTALKKEQDFICPVCKKKGDKSTMNIHHCLPVSKGGKTNKENCVAVHRTCHEWIHKTYGTRYYDPRKEKPLQRGM